MPKSPSKRPSAKPKARAKAPVKAIPHFRSEDEERDDFELISEYGKDRSGDELSDDEIFEKISSKRKELIKINASRHGIINGEGSTYVFRRILQFLDENFGKTGG